MRSIRVRSVQPLTNGIREARRNGRVGAKGESRKAGVKLATDGLGVGGGELFRVGYRHCFTVDENLICTVREATQGGRETDKREGEREKERGGQEERENALGWVLPCLSVGGGVKLNYPLVPRLPGDVCRGAGALALPPDVGGLHRYLCVRVYIYIRVRALPSLLSTRRRFQLKSTPGVGPDPACPPLVLLSSPTVLISLPNRRVPVFRDAFPPFPPAPFSSLLSRTRPSRLFRPSRFSASLLSYVYIMLLTRLCRTVSFV